MKRRVILTTQSRIMRKQSCLIPENAAPFFRLGGIYQQRKDEDNMIRVYQPALILEPNHPKIQHTLAVTFEKRFKTGPEDKKADSMQQALHHYGLANEHDLSILTGTIVTLGYWIRTQNRSKTTISMLKWRLKSIRIPLLSIPAMLMHTFIAG